MSSSQGSQKQGVRHSSMNLHYLSPTSTNQWQPPYAPQVAVLGGRPTETTDVPIAAVFIVLYLLAAVANLIIFKTNLRKGHKFYFNILLLQFSMARVLTCALRIGAAYHPANVSLSIAANIFVNVGILMVYIINLILAERILRARQPELGWLSLHRAIMKVLYALVAVALILLITFLVISSYTLDVRLRQTARKIELAGITYFLFFSCLPLTMVAATYTLPVSSRAESFGTGSMASKALIIAVSAGLCTLGAGFKAGANWETPRPVSDPAWYQSKAAFWIFIFAIEVIILCFLLAVRIDQRFWIPDGSGQRRTYSMEATESDDVKVQRRQSSSIQTEDTHDDDKKSLA